MLILMQGASGSGKSTIAEMIRYMMSDRFGQAIIVSADHYMTDHTGEYRFNPAQLGYCHACCQGDAERLLINPEAIVIVDNTNTTRREAQPYLAMATRYGHKVQVIRVDSRDFENTHGVPEETVVRQRGRMEDLL